MCCLVALSITALEQGKVRSYKQLFCVLQHDMLFFFASPLQDDPEQVPIDSVCLQVCSCVDAGVLPSPTSTATGCFAAISGTDEIPRSCGSCGAQVTA